MRLFILIFGFLTTCALAAFAHGGATGIVKQRMDGMVVLAQTMKSLKAIMSEQQDFSAATVAQLAQRVQAHAGDNMTKQFPEGSNPMVSEASDAIWTDWAEFEASAAALEQAAADLGESQSLATSQAAFDRLGQVCVDCHADFRIKK